MNDMDYYTMFLYILITVTIITWIAFGKIFIDTVDDDFHLDFSEQDKKNKREKV